MNTSYLETQEHLAADAQVIKSDSTFTELSTSDLELKFVSALEWDQLAHNFADIIPEQMATFNIGHWGKENLEFLTFRKKSKIVGGAVIIVRKIPFSGTGIAIVKWGPICQKLGANYDPVLYRNIISQVKKEYCERRNFHLTVMPLAKQISAEENQRTLSELGFDKGAGLAAPERYLVNVQDSAETLMSNLDQKWRYNLRKALKNKFDIKIVTPHEGLDQFLSLYSQMVERKKFLDASAIDALEKVIHDSPEKAQPIIVLVSHEGKVTAGGVFHVMGDMASYMFGATDERALKLKAGYALHWWVAEYLCNKQHIDWYDLGGNDCDKGLHQFKKGFVGKSGHILMSPHRYHFSKSILAKLAGFAAFRARDTVSWLKNKLHALKRNN